MSDSHTEVEKGVDVSDGLCNCSLMSVTNTAGNEGTAGETGDASTICVPASVKESCCERPDPVVPILKPDYAKRRPWLNAEEELLKRYYCVPFRMSIPWIARVLKRSEKSVQKKISNMKLRRVGLKNRGLKEWLRQGGSLELPESVVGLTTLTEADRKDAEKLAAELKRMWFGDEET